MSKLAETKGETVYIENEYKYLDENKAHLHTYLGKPLFGTSTVVGVLAKNLTWWSAELAAVECLEAGEKIPTIREEYLLACAQDDKKKAIDELQKKYPIFKKARFAHFGDKNAKALKGTDMHEVMEEYVTACIDRNEGKPLATFAALIDSEVNAKKLQNFIDWSILNVEKFMYSEKHVYSNTLWTGGIFDVIFRHKNGKICVGDFKSSKEAYDSQFIQCAGYDEQQSENGIFNEGGYQLSGPLKIEEYYVFPFGSDKFLVDVRHNTEELREGFRSCVVLHKLTNK